MGAATLLLLTLALGVAMGVGWCCWRDGSLGVLPDDDLAGVDEHDRAMRALGRRRAGRCRPGLDPEAEPAPDTCVSWRPDG